MVAIRPTQTNFIGNEDLFSIDPGPSSLTHYTPIEEILRCFDQYGTVSRSHYGYH